MTETADPYCLLCLVRRAAGSDMHRLRVYWTRAGRPRPTCGRTVCRPPRGDGGELSRTVAAAHRAASPRDPAYDVHACPHCGGRLGATGGPEHRADGPTPSTAAEVLAAARSVRGERRADGGTGRHYYTLHDVVRENVEAAVHADGGPRLSRDQRDRLYEAALAWVDDHPGVPFVRWLEVAGYRPQGRGESHDAHRHAERLSDWARRRGIPMRRSKDEKGRIVLRRFA